jgi:hypothetical protein
MVCPPQAWASASLTTPTSTGCARSASSNPSAGSSTQSRVSSRLPARRWPGVLTPTPRPECEDELFDMRVKRPHDMASKKFEFHLFVSSIAKGTVPEIMRIPAEDDAQSFWGKQPEAEENKRRVELDKVEAPFSALELYSFLRFVRACSGPSADSPRHTAARTPVCGRRPRTSTSSRARACSFRRTTSSSSWVPTFSSGMVRLR